MAAFPPDGYVSVASALPGIEVYAPQAQAREAEATVVDFKCPRCQATTAFSVADGGVRCAHCGYYEPPATPVVGKRAQEFEFTVATVSAAREAEGWGTERKTLRCQSCGSETSLPPGRLTNTCPFCGSHQVLQQDAPDDHLRPRFLIPFRVDAERCHTISREWLGSSWMTPRSLRDAGKVTDLVGVYVPYWTFDAQTSASWRAQVGHQVTDRYYDASDKTWKTRTRTVWRWESGSVMQVFDDLLVAGSGKLSSLLLQKIQDFDTRELVPYAPSYLAGLLAQAYDVPLEASWAAAREKMRDRTREACHGQASTSQVRSFTMSLDFSDESWRYVLVPAYVLAYRYGGQPFQVMINGQTGAIAGQRPVDWTKVWLAVAAMVAPGLLLGLLGVLASALGAVLPPSLLVGGGVLIVALVLLIIGAVFGVITFNKAKAMDDV